MFLLFLLLRDIRLDELSDNLLREPLNSPEAIAKVAGPAARCKILGRPEPWQRWDEASRALPSSEQAFVKLTRSLATEHIRKGFFLDEALIATQDLVLLSKAIRLPKAVRLAIEALVEDADAVIPDHETAMKLLAWRDLYPIPRKQLIPALANPVSMQEIQLMERHWTAFGQNPSPNGPSN